jgi:formylglycine-generating enzyme required for sulfatase activity
MHHRNVVLPTLFLSILAVVACISAPALADDAPLSAERERGLKPKDVFKECDACPEMVVVPAGSFTMGSPDNEKDRDKDESPQHGVTIARPFAVGKFEVTLDQFAAFVKETGYDAGSECFTFEQGKGEKRSGRSFRNPGYGQNGSHPAACVNWDDAKAYVGWLSRKTGKTYRLLTEAEWEYAARARTTPGSAPRFHFGDDEKAMCRYGNGADQTAKKSIPGAANWPVLSCDDGYAYTAPVGSFTANAFGLYDMHGNVWEWTEDCYHDSYRGAPTDGSAWTAGDCKYRVVRGGSWSFDSGHLRAANRVRDASGSRFVDYGLRVARTLTGLH